MLYYESGAIQCKGKKVYACFIDFSKAYDSVWRNGLLYKLILNGLSLKFILLIKSMYTELQAAVKLPNGVTPYFSSLVGVRQGCNLSPMLFNLFVNDIFDLFDNAKCDPVKLQTKLIHCLMYADDLLILSETENGLTKSLERLSNYAKKWKLKISAKKTKIIVFNKAGKIISVKIRMDDIIIQSCSEYAYLGTIFTPGNSFKRAQIELCKKACRTFFLFLSAVNVQAGAQVSTVRKLFNSLVCHILLYNSEIWGAFMKPKQLRNLESFKDNLFSDNLKHESLQLKMAKISLGVHRKASNMAVRGEIGMYPLNIEIYVRIVKYCFHLLELAEQGNELIKLGLRECITLVSGDKKCWLTPVLYILRIIGIDPDLTQMHLIKKDNIISLVRNKLEDHFKEKFRKEVGNSSRLTLYSSIKDDFKEEQYISDVKYYKYRSAITKFRISARTFPIEKGRWQSIPRDQRLCPLCLGNLIGDEKHYIFHCTMDKLVDIRKDFVKELHESNLQPCFNDAAFSELTGMILKGTCCMKLDKIGKFLSAVLERTDALLRETK